MRKNEFFAVLKEDLPEDRYKARLLRELEDHWEDCEAKDSKKKAEERLGDPHEFIIFYQDVMKKHLSLYLEALFIGLCSMPLGLLPMIGNLFTEMTEILLLKGLIFGVTLALDYFFFLYFYSWVWHHLCEFGPISRALAKRLLAPLLLPVFYVVASIVFIFHFDTDHPQDYLYPLVLGIYLLAQTVAAWMALKVDLRFKSLFRGLSLLFVAYILSGLVIYYGAGSIEGIGLFDSLFAFIYFVRVLLVLPFGSNYILASTVLGLLAALVFSYSVRCLYLAIQTKKSIPFGKTLLALFIVYAFCFSHASETKMEWSVPYISLSRTWEDQRLGWFSNWYEFLSQDGERRFSYAARWMEEGLELIDQHGDAIVLETLSTDSQNLQWKTKEGLQEEFMDGIQNQGLVLSSDFQCSDTRAVEDEDKVLVLGGDAYCQELSYRGQLIYSAPAAYSIKNLFLSPDGGWLILQFSEGGYSGFGDNFGVPDEVFAVDLSL